DPVGRFLAERHGALLAALPTDRQALLVEVDVAEIEVDRLAAPQPGRIHELDEGAVTQGQRSFAVERLELGVDLLGLWRLRQATRTARGEGCVRDAGRSERESQKRSDSRQLSRDRRRRE